MKKIVGRPPDKVDIDRILGIPIRTQMGPEDLEIMSFETLKAESFMVGERLNPAQAMALQSYFMCDGAILPIGVGLGKTGCVLMIAQQAIDLGRAKRVMILFPVHLIRSLVERHIPEWRRRVNLSVNFHHFAGRTRHARKKLAESKAPGVYVMPYSLLSQKDAMELLEATNPDLIVADEVHRLKNPRSAATKRVIHYIKERDPSPRFVGMSGTITNKGIMEYHHLMDVALREQSPLPRSTSLAYSWAMTLDAGATPSPAVMAGSMGPLMNWARKNFPDDEKLKEARGISRARIAYQLRMTSAPGVVASGDERPNASLLFTDLRTDEPGERLKELLEKLPGETPQGEPIDHTIHAYKWEYELSAGFYNSLVWPSPEDYAKNHRVSVPHAEEVLERAKEHHEARKAYHAELRSFFDDAPIGLDTPDQVGLSAMRYGPDYVGQTIYRLWREVKDRDFKGRPNRSSIPVRVDDFKVRAAVEWAGSLDEPCGVIWYFNRGMGIWLTEALQEAGFDPLFCPAGAEQKLEAVGDPVRGGRGIESQWPRSRPTARAGTCRHSGTSYSSNGPDRVILQSRP